MPEGVKRIQVTLQTTQPVPSASHRLDMVRTHKPNLLKGIVAGLIGGLVGVAAKSIAERIYPPRIHGEPEPHHILAEKLAGRHLSRSESHVTEEAIHWGFGAAAGVAYGALAEYYPAATSNGGAAFGATLTTLTHGTTLPALGLSTSSEEQSKREKRSEVASHVVYGIATETVRSIVRGILR